MVAQRVGSFPELGVPPASGIPTPILDGRSLSEAGLHDLARRVELLRHEGAPSPRLLALASAADPSAPQTLHLKATAAARAGIGFRARLVREGDSLEALLAEAAVDPSIHGIFVQWSGASGPQGKPVSTAFPGPLTPLLDLIPPDKDVDVASSRSRAALEAGSPIHRPAEAMAIVAALEALGVRMPGTGVTLVGGPGPRVAGIAATLRLVGAFPERVEASDPGLPGALGRAAVVVTLEAPPGEIPGAWLRPGSVVVDGGYTVPSGHLRLGPDNPTLAGRVPHRGGIGPLTVLALLQNTLAAARAAAGETPGG